MIDLFLLISGLSKMYNYEHMSFLFMENVYLHNIPSVVFDTLVLFSTYICMLTTRFCVLIKQVVIQYLFLSDQQGEFHNTSEFYESL